MSDAMNIKLTEADFKEMDANTLLGLHNKILESRDEAIAERDAAREGLIKEGYKTEAMNIKRLHWKGLCEHRDAALVEYALQNLLGDDV
jgi:hypothetical protein